MEILKIKVEPLSDRKQDDLLDIKVMKNKEAADSSEEISLHTSLKFDKTNGEQEEKCDVTSDKSENISVHVKTEKLSNLLQDDVISKFSYSDDEDQGGSCYNVMNVKTETEYQKDIESGLERTSAGLSRGRSKFVISGLSEMRTEAAWKEFAEDICKKVGIRTEMVHQGGQRSAPRHLFKFIITSNTGQRDEPTPYARRHTFYAIIDRMLDELNRRFLSDACSVLMGATVLNPKHSTFLDKQALLGICITKNDVLFQCKITIYTIQAVISLVSQKQVSTHWCVLFSLTFSIGKKKNWSENAYMTLNIRIPLQT